MKAAKHLFIYIMGAATVIGFIVLTSYTDPDKQKNATNSTTVDQNTTQDNSSQTMDTDPVQTVNAPSLPDSITFAGEHLPMDNFDARERFDREFLSMCFWHSKMIAIIKLSNRYFPIMEEIFKEHGLPDDFKYLAVTESSLRNATSPAGAKGIWQFMPATGKEYGLVINSEIDERYHIEKATAAACKYLKKSYKKFDSWLLAAAAYNMGGPRLKTRIEAQHTNKYFDLYLNQETSRYVPRIMAAKEVMTDPKKYGFNIAEKDLYVPLPKFKIVTVDGAISSWSDFAKEHNISYRELKVFNPWIISTKLTNKSRHSFDVKVPTK
ncbi:MAG: lytic transglycosylase domain-containing protein [Aureispira sp.]|nr:lytic transglycosylase domain-containing protein [Aureispira sp.]